MSTVTLKTMEQVDLVPLFKLLEDDRTYFSTAAASISEVTSLHLLTVRTDQILARDGVVYTLVVDGQIAGSYTINSMDHRNEKAVIGYWLSPKFGGKGFAKNGLELLLKICFEQKKVNRVEAYTATSNLRSVKLLEQAGFIREGVIRKGFKVRGELVDDYLYSILRNEWIK